MAQTVYFEDDGVKLLAPILPEYAHILTREALRLVRDVTRMHRPEWERLMAERRDEQTLIDEGGTLDSPQDDVHGRWQVAPIPEYLRDRRVEVVCPAGNRKMLLGAMNSRKLGAPICLGDLEDANGCQWGPGGIMDGLVNLWDAARGTLKYDHPEKGPQTLDKDPCYLMVRPRGLHFTEPRVLVDDKPVPAFIFDVVMHMHHNGPVLQEKGRGTDFYLAKLQNGKEARWCNNVVTSTEPICGLVSNSAHVSVLFEHIKGVLQIHQIIWELRYRFVAGNTGWLDYLASLSRTFRRHDDYVMPDPGQVTIETPCMAAYKDLVISACHQHGAMAIGGTATQLAVTGDDEATKAAKARVRANAEPYADAGFDGGWVIYAPFTPIIAEVFGKALGDLPNQLHITRDDVNITAEQLLTPPEGTISMDGVDECVIGALEYETGWLGGTAAVAITYRTKDGKPNRLMEDAATGERKREDLWKWNRVGARLVDGQQVTFALIFQRLTRVLQARTQDLGSTIIQGSKYWAAAEQLLQQVAALDPPAYFPPELLGLVIAEEAKQFPKP